MSSRPLRSSAAVMALDFHIMIPIPALVILVPHPVDFFLVCGICSVTSPAEKMNLVEFDIIGHHLFGTAATVVSAWRKALGNLAETIFAPLAHCDELFTMPAHSGRKRA